MTKVQTIIGIAGGSGSGKSTLVEELLRRVSPGKIALLSHDAYYKDHDQMPQALREAGNWDHPDALDSDQFVEHLSALCAGDEVLCPEYDFSTHRRKVQTQVVVPKPLLIVEGILLFAVPEIAHRIDLRIFVETPAEERLARRVLRDTSERGRSVDSVLQQYRETVRPMHDRYVQPSRQLAHLIVPWDWNADTRPVVEMLCDWLEMRVAKRD